MAAIRISPESELRQAVNAAFARHRAHVLELVPDAEVVHVGSTSIPGALTKGGLDLLMRVGADRFDKAAVLLRGPYRIHQPENWTPTLASFAADAAEAPPVGVQGVVAASADDAVFEPFRDALIRDPALLAEYNALKRSLDGEDYERYTDVKAAFVERVLAAERGSRI
jgi:GrpB-like predicted nucleotidyltransferase (UPF0157 family)